MDALLFHECTIRRSTPTNTDGVVRQVYSDVATGVRCLIQEGRGSVRRGRVGQNLEYGCVAFFLPTADIRPSGSNDQPDVVTVTKGPSHLVGVSLRVIHAGDPAGMGTHLEVALERLPDFSE